MAYDDNDHGGCVRTHIVMAREIGIAEREYIEQQKRKRTLSTTNDS
jgi:hypothetical protein